MVQNGNKNFNKFKHKNNNQNLKHCRKKINSSARNRRRINP